MKLWAFIGFISLASSLECEGDQINFVFLGGVRNQEFCHNPGSCINLPNTRESWSERAELIRVSGARKENGTTCASFFKSYDCGIEESNEKDVFRAGCSDGTWGHYFPKNWTHSVIKSYRVWYKEDEAKGYKCLAVPGSPAQAVDKRCR